MKQLGYSEIVEQIENVPVTFLGGILIAAIQQCRKKKFFRDDEALLKAVKNLIQSDDKSAG